jgi:ABC-type amino acid transport substrate-binding protein
MNQKAAFVVMIFVIVFCFSSCQKSNQTKQEKIQDNVFQENDNQAITVENKKLYSSDIQNIKDRGKLIVAMAPDNNEIFYRTAQNGQLKGIDIDIAKEIATNLGVEATFDRTAASHDQLQDKLLDNSADVIISHYSKTPDRASKFFFTQPYNSAKFGLMVNKSELVKNNAENSIVNFIKNNPVKIGALKCSSYVKKLKELFPNCTVIEMESYDELGEATNNGNLFGFWGTEEKFLVSYAKNPLYRLYTQVFLFNDAKDNICVAVNKNNENLFDYVNAIVGNFVTIDINMLQKECKKYAEETIK